ncbi:unannotated protein [freshwater metagenome]|uniref:Unannotated protein n=1 Tax=freshwater metagenome TaxID=449393 RepID=A0A6J7HZ13_9ZZZZ
MSAWIASTRRAMSSVARAVSCASSLTSLATTAKPLPASPARAASIVAFSASRLVCSAIDVITLITSPISFEDTPSLVIVALVRSASATASAATRAASLAFCAISRIDADISSAPAATVATLRDTSSAADDTDPDCTLVCSADAAICAADADSSSLEAATASADPTTEAISERSWPCAVPSASAIRPSSSRECTAGVTVRSPCSSASRDTCTEDTERLMPRMTYQATSEPSSTMATSPPTMVQIAWAALASVETICVAASSLDRSDSAEKSSITESTADCSEPVSTVATPAWLPASAAGTSCWSAIV